MPRNYVRESVPLSRFGVLVAQLESIVVSASQKSPDALLCFDLLSDLISFIDEEPKNSILLWQRKCEDALYSLLILGARRPVRHLTSVAMARIILKGDSISIYSRVSSLQGFLSDGKRSEPQKVAGAAQCLGELYRHFGRRITSGLLETTMIASKLMKFNEEFVRQEALFMLQNALEGCGGTAAASAYSEAFRLIMRFAIGDKSYIVRIAAARCLKAFALIGGPGLGVGELDNSAAHCVKGLEDPVSSVRDAFAEALGSLLALGMNPQAQVQPKGKGPFPPAKKLEGGLQRHLALPFTKANGARSKNMRVGLTLSWVYFLQTIRLKYLHPDVELQDYALQVLDMLRLDTFVDAHEVACVLYILRVGITDQMTEPTQRSFLVFLGKQLQSLDGSPSMKIAALRTLSYTLMTLGEVPSEFKEVFDITVVAAVSHSSQLVRIEAALTLRALAEVDQTCVGGLISYGVTTLNALRENVSFEKGSSLRVELDLLHGQATVLAALVFIAPKLPLGCPARSPKLVLEVSKRMLIESSRNMLAATVEKEVGWLLLSSLLASVPKEELEDQVFDILSLWATLFSGNADHLVKQDGDFASRICVLSTAVDALIAFVRCFVSPAAADSGILLQPVMVYLSRALSYISAIIAKELPNSKPAMDIFIIRTLIAYQSLPDPMAYKTDHAQLIHLCTIPYRDASTCEESSCLRLLLDKRDAGLGPWIPGRDWLEDELRAFQGGKDGLMPCVWENEVSSFPQPETIRKTLVNQMLLCFGIMFASQDSIGKLSLLGLIEQCLKAGKKQSWRAASVTNICVGLLAGLKASLNLRQPLGSDVLNSTQAIFQTILAEGEICASQRRASCEGLGLLARLGNDISAARMTRLLLGDLSGITDSSYAGSIALALGCIHRSAGGMALSSLVPATVSLITSLAKTLISGLQLWSLHALTLTIEAAGLSFVSHVQATLGLAMDILLSEENGCIDIQQGVGRLINAIVAVLGPELSPGSIFFSRCKSVVAEISSGQETATLLESVRFTQQLVLFAPQAVSVNSHVQTLLKTLSSRQPTLRHLAISTLRHLIEKDPDSVIEEQIEAKLFHILDEETDPEIGNLVRTAIMRLLYASCPSCPSHWILICRNMVLATSSRGDAEFNNSDSDLVSGADGEARLNYSDDGENMVSSSKGLPIQGYAFEASSVKPNREKHLRYRTRVFAAECLSHLPAAVGTEPAHFDLSLARKRPINMQGSCDWLVLHVQELISLAYQISTIQFENMRPLGLGLLSMILDKFEMTPDPDLPGHLLLEQFQAQLVSAVRTALDTLSSPILLEAGLQLATKIMTSGIISGDQAAVKRIFSLISHPLNDFKDLYYPSFAEWVSCKIKIRLLAAHASLKCYTYASLKRHHDGVPDEFLALLPLFSKSSSTLGKYWIQILKDYSYTFLGLNLKRKWNPFLDGIQSPLVLSKLQSCFEEAWPVILQAVALDAVPVKLEGSGNTKTPFENILKSSLISGYSMVELEREEYQFLWGFALLIVFQGQHSAASEQKIALGSAKAKFGGNSAIKETNPLGLKLYEIVLPVFQFLSAESFFTAGFLTLNVCQELLQVFLCSICMDYLWNSLAISVLSQIVHNCPEDFFKSESFAYLGIELCSAYLFKFFQSTDFISPDHLNQGDLISPLFMTAKTLMAHLEPKMQSQFKSVAMAFLLIGYQCVRQASTELCLSKIVEFIKCAISLLKKVVEDPPTHSGDGIIHLRTIFGTCLNVVTELTTHCIEGIHQLEKNRSDFCKLLQLKLAFSLEQNVSLAKLVHQIECPGDSKDKIPISLIIFKSCTKSIRTALTDSNVQVQAIGLQVLKSMVQRSTSKEDYNLLLFFSGVLVRDIFTIIQKILKKPITKESMAIAGECLRILMLLQTGSKTAECQRCFMNLLLEAVVMVFSASEGGSSQEANDIRSTAVRLVSHVAQIPSSAVHLKDALLSMPAMHRQQLQGVIRASVTQDHNSSQMKPVVPSLAIKLPGPGSGKIGKDSLPSTTVAQQTEVCRERDLPATATSIHSDEESIGESEDDDDDWDTFQSFPASTAAETYSKVESTVEGSQLVEDSSALESNTRKDDFQELNPSQPLDIVTENNVPEDPEAREMNLAPDCPGDVNDMEGHDLKKKLDVMEPSDNDRHQEIKEEMVPSQETDIGAITSQAEEGIASDIQLTHDTKELMEANSTEDHEQRKEGLDNKIDEEDEGSSKEHVEHEVKMDNPDNEIGCKCEVTSDCSPSKELSASGVPVEEYHKADESQHKEADEDAEE